MKKYSIIFGIIAFVSFATNGYSQTNASEILESAIAEFNSLSDITAEVVNSHSWDHQGDHFVRLDTEAIIIKKEKMKITSEYEETFCNGKYVWYYYKLSKETLKVDDDPIEIAHGDYFIRLYEEGAKCRHEGVENSRHHLSITPQDESGGVRKVEIWISEKTNILEKKTYWYSDGSISTSEWINVKINQNVPDSIFTYDEVAGKRNGVVLDDHSTPEKETKWIYFSDKGPDAQSLLGNPKSFLSERSIARRAKQNIRVDMKDVPVCQDYINQLANSGVKILAVSKWLNAVAVESNLGIETLKMICPSVKKAEAVIKYEVTIEGYDLNKTPEENARMGSWDYGDAQDQSDIINIGCLHDMGYTGAGVLTALFDAGFLSVDTMAVYSPVWAQNRFVDYYDFVDNDTLLFQENIHGQWVLSTIVSNLPGVMIGTAPDASFLLARTEAVATESHQEEYNWVEAMEWADSIGADIIHSSLGYFVMDTALTSYTYADMDGNTTIIAIAADIAASRGILVNNSAGNEGGGAWHYIITPCDGDSVLCVGSVDNAGVKSGFSSFGPSSDGDIKPDVMAMGSNTAAMDPFSPTPITVSGTSLSGPQIAGLAACLIQGHPSRTAQQIADAIRQCADRFLTPDSLYGYGIPDACKADSILTAWDSIANIHTLTIIGPPLQTIYCEGETFMLTYGASGIYNIGNQFIAQLSDAFGNFAAPVTIGSVTDTALVGGIVCTIPLGTTAGTAYRIRVVSTQPVYSGTDNGNDIEIKLLPVAAFSGSISNTTYTTTNTSSNATSYAWTFGDGGSSALMSPSHIYINDGNYTVTLIATNSCGSDTTTDLITILDADYGVFVNTIIFPNPFEDKLFIQPGIHSGTIEFYDVIGQEIRKENFTGNFNEIVWNTKEIPQGIYFLKISNGVHERVWKVVKRN